MLLIVSDLFHFISFQPQKTIAMIKLIIIVAAIMAVKIL